MAHTHTSNLLSGVYYVQMPPGSSPIIFHDPRGPLTPFDNTLKIQPEVGFRLSSLSL
jgi:hypothetical protein